MLENLDRSLGMAFKDYISTEMCDDYGENLLAIDLDGVQLLIKEDGGLFAVSRFRPDRFEVDIDVLATGAAASGTTVASSI